MGRLPITVASLSASARVAGALMDKQLAKKKLIQVPLVKFFKAKFLRTLHTLGDKLVEVKKVNKFPLVSVVVPSFNHENYIEKCINTLVEQTYPNIEIVIVDDGSTDGSQALIDSKIKEWASKRKVVFIKNKDSGTCCSRNQGIELSKGEYIALCDSDDYSTPSRILEQVKFMQAHSECGLLFSGIFIDRFGKIKRGRFFNKPLISFEDFLFQKLYGTSTSTQFFRRKVFDEVGLGDVSVGCQDWDLSLRVAAQFEVCYLKKRLGFYRHHVTNMHKTMKNKLQDDQLKILKKWEHMPQYQNAVYMTNFLSRKNKEIKLFILLKCLGFKKTIKELAKLWCFSK